MNSLKIIGFVAVMAILATGCSTNRESQITLTQGGGMYSALDATAQVYSHTRSQAPVDDNPIRYVGFALHPVGVILDYAINRPIYFLASTFPYIFGYTSEDVLVSSQRQ
jgi:hypothetical protein